MKRTLVLVFLIVSIIGLQTGNAFAGSLWFNTLLPNTTGNIVNDYHMKYVHTKPMTVQSIYNCCEPPSVSWVKFPTAVPAGSGSNTVTLDWSGATLNNGEQTHIGAYITWDDGGEPVITENYWTFGGTEVVPRPVVLDPSWSSGNGGGYSILRYELLDTSTSTTLSVNWQEMDGGPGPYTLTNNSTRTVTVSGLSTRRVSRPIPGDQLNVALGGFGDPLPDFVLAPGAFSTINVPNTGLNTSLLAVLGFLILTMGTGLVVQRKIQARRTDSVITLH